MSILWHFLDFSFMKDLGIRSINDYNQVRKQFPVALNFYLLIWLKLMS